MFMTFCSSCMQCCLCDIFPCIHCSTVQRNEDSIYAPIASYTELLYDTYKTLQQHVVSVQPARHTRGCKKHYALIPSVYTLHDVFTALKLLSKVARLKFLAPPSQFIAAFRILPGTNERSRM